jgi:hypothetical protein
MLNYSTQNTMFANIPTSDDFVVIDLNDYTIQQNNNQDDLVKIFLILSLTIILFPIILFTSTIMFILLPIFLLIYSQYKLLLYLFDHSLSFIKNLKNE